MPLRPTLDLGVPKSGLYPTTPSKPSGSLMLHPSTGWQEKIGSVSSNAIISTVDPAGNARPRYEVITSNEYGNVLPLYAP